MWDSETEHVRQWRIQGDLGVETRDFSKSSGLQTSREVGSFRRWKKTDHRTRANPLPRSGTDADSISDVDAHFRAKCVIALEQPDEILRKLFRTPTAPSEIQERCSGDSRQVFEIRLART